MTTTNISLIFMHTYRHLNRLKMVLSVRLSHNNIVIEYYFNVSHIAVGTSYVLDLRPLTLNVVIDL